MSVRIPPVPTFQSIAKQNKFQVRLATVDLAEGIFVDIFFCNSLPPLDKHRSHMLLRCNLRVHTFFSRPHVARCCGQWSPVGFLRPKCGTRLEGLGSNVQLSKPRFRRLWYRRTCAWRKCLRIRGWTPSKETGREPRDRPRLCDPRSLEKMRNLAMANLQHNRRQWRFILLWFCFENTDVRMDVTCEYSDHYRPCLCRPGGCRRKFQ